MKKLGKISFILLSILCMTISSYAASCSMSMESAKNEYKPNDDVVVDVKLTNIDAGSGIIALEGVLEYDTNSLTYVKMEGQNGWETPTYNTANGMFSMLRWALVTTPETALKITFKVKDQSAKSSTITLKNIKASGGIATGDIAVANISKTITVNTPTPPPANNTTNTNTNTNTTPTNNTVPNTNTIITPTNNTGSNTNTNAGASTNQNKTPTSNSTIVATTGNGAAQTDNVKTGILPKTGATRIGLAVLLIAAGVAVVFYIKMKKLDINVK